MRDPDRIDLMVELLREVWKKNPDWRLGQVVGNAARLDNAEEMKKKFLSSPLLEGVPPEVLEQMPMPPFAGKYRDPFNVEDDELWTGLERLRDDNQQQGEAP